MTTPPTQTDEHHLEELWTELCEGNGTPEQYDDLRHLQEVLREQESHEERIVQENQPSSNS